MSSVIFQTLSASGSPKRTLSETLTPDFAGLVLGSEKMPIAQGGVGLSAYFDFGSRVIRSNFQAFHPYDLVNKEHLEAVQAGLIIRDAVRLATNAALPSYTAAGTGSTKTLTADANGALSIDGTLAAIGDRVLIKNEGATSVHHGIYDVTAAGDLSNPFVLTRSFDMDGVPSYEVRGGVFTFVQDGTENSDSGWLISTNGAITVDTTPFAFTQFSGAGQLIAGVALEKSGNTINVKVDDASVSINGSNQIEVKALGVTTGKLADSAVTTLKINDAAVTAVKLQDGAVTTTKIVNENVTAAKLATDSVETLKIKDLNVTDAKLAADSVTTAKILDANVTTAKIADANVTTAKILDANVTAAKLAADSVTTVKILDANVTTSKVADGAITAPKLDADSVITAKILDANVTAAKLAADSVTTAKIVDANVTANKLAVDSVETAKIKDAAVEASKLAVDSVETAKIKDLNVTEGKLAANAVTSSKIAESAIGEGLEGGNGVAISVVTGDGVRISEDAVCADYSQALGNDNANPLEAGQIVYVKANGNVDLASKVTASDDVEIGIVFDESIENSDFGAVIIRRGAIVDGFVGLTPGKKYYVGTEGEMDLFENITFVAGEHVHSVGKALSSTKLIFNPRYEFEF